MKPLFIPLKTEYFRAFERGDKTNANLVGDDEQWTPLRAPFGYYGGKQRVASQIVGELPVHNAWVEAFCGSATLTLAKKPVPIEVINDINGDVVNFFRQLRNNSSKLCDAIRLTPYSREEFKLARLREKDLPDLERARCFYIAAMMAINGSFGKDCGGFSISNSYARRDMEARVSRWTAMPSHLELIANRLRRVRVENKDAIELFRDFMARPATLMYLDPPYLADRSHGYDHDERSETYHEQLLVMANKAKCMVLISGYESELYNELLTSEKGWHRRQIKATTRGHNGKDSERTEIVWVNKQYMNVLKSGRVPLRFSAAEKKHKKVNPER